MFTSLTALTLAEIDSMTEDRSVVLFSPRLRNHNALMGAFISFPDAYLHTLTENETTLSTFASGLVADLRDFLPNFGSQTLQAVQAAPADLADALVSDLKQPKSAIKTLILDDFDKLSSDDDVATFFERLVSKLPRGMKLVVNARSLRYRPWGALVHSGEAIALGEENALDGGIFIPSAPADPHLEVYGFGTGHVYINGLPVETWDGPLPRNLFFYFIDHPMITRDEIFDTFWPGLATKEATNVFHVTKRKVSERLGYELTSYSGGFYRPSDQINIHYDVGNFEKEVAIGEEGGKESIDTWYRAIRLYRNEFLHTTEMPWIDERREQLKLTYSAALISVGRIYKSLGDTDKAISFYLRALREVPQREDIHRDLMTIYEGRGERDKAVAQYKALRDILKRTLGIAPSSATRTLYSMLTGETDS
jgi:DNA-binding SARP family transcriptional activator